MHDDELTREIVNSPKFFPAGWIEPYAVIERPGRYDQNLVCVNTFSLDAGAGVQIAGRFVREHQFRVVDQGAGDGDALLLAAGQLAGMVAQAVPDAHLLEGLQRALSAVAQRSQWV